jgi:hypothetical protein
MQKIAVYGFENNGVLKEFADGAQNLGYHVVWRRHDVFTPDQHENFDLVVVNGLRKQNATIRETYEERGVPVVVTDLGYLNRKQGYYQVGLNKIGWIPDFDCPKDRFNELGVSYSPKNPKDGFLLVCGQMPNDAAHRLPELELNGLFETKIKYLRQITDREIVWRPHPLRKLYPEGSYTISDADTLGEALEGAYAVVTHNSTAGLEALVKGYPVFCPVEAFYSDLCNTDLNKIDSPVFPDKKKFEDFMSKIAYAQWTLEELKEGKAQTFLINLLNGIIPKGDIENEQSYKKLDGENDGGDRGISAGSSGNGPVTKSFNGRFTSKNSGESSSPKSTQSVEPKKLPIGKNNAEKTSSKKG